MSPGVGLPPPERPKALKRFEVTFSDGRPARMIEAAHAKPEGDFYVFYDKKNREIERFPLATTEVSQIS